MHLRKSTQPAFLAHNPLVSKDADSPMIHVCGVSLLCPGQLRFGHGENNVTMLLQTDRFATGPTAIDDQPVINYYSKRIRRFNRDDITDTTLRPDTGRLP